MYTRMRPKLVFTLYPVEPITAEDVIRYRQQNPEAAAKIDKMLEEVYEEYPEMRPAAKDYRLLGDQVHEPSGVTLLEDGIPEDTLNEALLDRLMESYDVLPGDRAAKKRRIKSFLTASGERR